MFLVLSMTAGKQKSLNYVCVYSDNKRLLFDCVVQSVQYQVNRMISNLRIYVLQASLFVKTYTIIILFIVFFASFVVRRKNDFWHTNITIFIIIIIYKWE